MLLFFASYRYSCLVSIVLIAGAKLEWMIMNLYSRSISLHRLGPLCSMTTPSLGLPNPAACPTLPHLNSQRTKSLLDQLRPLTAGPLLRDFARTSKLQGPCWLTRKASSRSLRRWNPSPACLLHRDRTRIYNWSWLRSWASRVRACNWSKSYYVRATEPLS
jgi:hypothetical protein